MHIVTVGDVALDVLVDAPFGLHEDDDTEARIVLAAGGQAANVAAWAVELGARATVVAPRANTVSADLVAEQLARTGVDLVEISVSSIATVVSLLAAGTRTLLSDAGDQSWVDRLDPSVLPTDIDWLHVSGYPLLRARDPAALVAFVEAVRRRGVSVSLDLSSAALVTAFGPARFAAVVRQLEPTLIFANEPEWAALDLHHSNLRCDVVIKRGAAGATVVVDDVASKHVAPAVDVVDLTGAGDALAAGYLVGGIDVALQTAARCVVRRGAQPVDR